MTHRLRYMGDKHVGTYCLWGLLGPVLFLSNVALACPQERQVPGEYLVRLSKNISTLANKSTSSFDSFLQQNNFAKKTLFNPATSKMNVMARTSVQRLPKLELVKNINSKRLYDLLKSHPDVLSVEPNCYIDPMRVPNDNYYNNQWAHEVIESELAWDMTIGSQEVIVAISDSGVDYNHSDLKDQMWTNDAELNGQSGVDDDGNGYVDDIYGYDTADGDGDPRPGTASSAAHGTHVAGIVGARGGNSIGVTGLNWQVKIMAVKGFFDDQAGTTTSALLETIYYAVDNGAKVINCSWGGQGAPDQASRDAFTYALNNGVVPVVAAGNDATNASNFTPAAIGNVITVAASGSSDQLASFSNYGTVIDLMAPGGDAPSYGGADESILSTVPNSQYGGMRGTSMAAPYVAGLAALILSVNQNLTPAEVLTIMKDTADSVSVTVPRTGANYTYKRINAFKAIEETLNNYSDDGDGGDDGGTGCDPNVDDNCRFDDTLPGFGRGSLMAENVLNGMGGCGKGFEAKDSLQSEANRMSQLLVMLIIGMPLFLVGFIRRKK